MTTEGIAGGVFALVAAGVVAFQLALAAGAPWGAYAMGGAFPGRYPPALRVLAVVQGAVIGLLVVVVLSDAGLVAASIAEASGPVLLIDDYVDSRWTITEASRVLRQAGATQVLPFVLAISA